MQLREKHAKAHAKPSWYCFEVDFCSFDNPSCIVPLHIVTVVGLFIYGLMNQGFLSKMFCLFLSDHLCVQREGNLSGPVVAERAVATRTKKLHTDVGSYWAYGFCAGNKNAIQCTSCVQVL